MRVGARDLRSAVVVLVGATSGMGRASALAFADHGARLVLVARDADALEEVVTACHERGAAAVAVPTDVADAEAVDRLAERSLARFGRIDVWVHAASTMIAGDLEDHPAEEIRRLVDTNVTGCLNGARTALRTFRGQGSGVLIVVSSLLGLLPNPLAPAYVASKYAARGLALSLRQAVAGERDIHVCTVLPGPVDTPIFDRAANHTGQRLRAIPPAQSVERAAAMLVSVARRPRRQATTGVVNRLLLLGHRLAPRPVEWAVALWSARLLTGSTATEDHRGALFAPPASGDAHGGFRRGARRRRLGDAVGARLARRGADR
jgi:short-subunit dehydrogenase